MSKKTPKIVILLLLAIFSISMCLLTSCNNDPVVPGETETSASGDVIPSSDIDNVFFMQEDGKEYLFTITGNQFMFSGLDGDTKGSYTYNKDTGALTLTIKDGGSATASAILENNILKLTYNGNSYRLVKREYFTVTYADGETEIAKDNVLNTTFAHKPADPKKDGYAFIGWYADAEYKTPFAFGETAISQNTTVYARFEKITAGMNEYTVTLIKDGAVYSTVKTVSGVVYNLPTPEGENFVGWWVSDYQSADKLTAQYTGQPITEDTSFYAVYKTEGQLLVSVTATGVSWNSLGATVNYKVAIKKGDTTVAENSTGDTSYKFDFTGKDAGDYTVTVTANGATSTVYYRNKALDRVCGFRVVSSHVLVFSPVPNAQRYYVTVLCGSENHTHVRESIGNSTNYNFGNCAMPAEGIRFVVTAVADGYMDSVSDVFTYSLALDPAEGVSVDNQNVTWYPVENATAYYVELSTDGKNYVKFYVANGTTYSVAGMPAGKIYAKVTPVSDGYYSAPAKAVTYTKTTLAMPGDIAVKGNALTWTAVAGATGYNVNIAGKIFKADTNTLTLEDGMLAGGVSAYEVSVQALGDSAEKNSVYSAVTTVNYMSMGAVYYQNGYVYWTPVVGAAGYRVTIDGRTYNVGKDENRYAVIFAHDGVNTVSVCYTDTNGDNSKYISVDVITYEFEFDTRGGKAAGSIFKAIGDQLILPETSRAGYDFAGWYTAPNGLDHNGKEYTDTVVDNLGGRVLYAAWSAEKYELTMETGNGKPSTITVTYGIVNNAFVPENTDSTRMFYGWYTEPNGAGTRYFDENGAGLGRWNATEGFTLYAYFPEILKFNLLGDGKSYSVEQGKFGIGTATEITIPATHEGFPVTTVDAGAFVSCVTLETINIPNTIENIELGLQGTNSTGSAFQSCSKLSAINIYEVDGAIDPIYHSNDGVLYKTTQTTREIVCYPYAKTGVLIIEEGTTLIPVSVFRSSKLIEVQIPYTVQSISAEAFYSCSSLERVVFLPSPEGATEQPLSLAAKTFYSCSKLESILLPARLTDFTADCIGSCSALTSIEIAEGNSKYFSLGEAGRKVICSNENGSTVLVFCPKGMEGEYTIPTGVSIIGDSAFKSCSKITTLNIPGSVTEIRANAFASCSNITVLNFEEEGLPLTIRESAFYSCSGLTSLTLPSGLVKLEKNAFGATSKLTSVIIHAEGIQVSEDDTDAKLDFATGAFASTAATPAYYVTDVTIGENVPEFELVGVFGQKVERINVEAGNKHYSDVDGVLFNAEKTSILFYPSSRIGEYVLPATVTTIGANVFNGKVGLTKITIGKNITAIGDYAFKSCTKLEQIVFEEGGTAKLVIGNDAFYLCSGLTSLVLPAREGGLEIGNEAFRSCSKLTSLVIPEGVTTIGYSTFSGCSLIETITLPSTLETMPLNAKGIFDTFYPCLLLKEIKFSGENANFTVIDGVLYKKTEGVITDLMYCPQSKGGSTVVAVPSSVTNVYTQAFYSNKVVTEVIFEDLVAGSNITFGTDVFYSCAAMTKIRLPKGLTTIANSMFDYCSSLTEIVIPNTVTSIENKAFYCCKNLSSIVFEPVETVTPENALVIQDASSQSNSPFASCSSLKNIVFPERMTELGNYAFAAYTDNYGGESDHVIETVTFPSTLKRIGNYAFNLARNLKSVTFADGTILKDTSTTVFAIGNNAFYHTDSLTSINLPDNNDGTQYTLGSSAFSYCGLTSVEIPKAIKEMKASAFSYAPKITTVTFAEGAAPTLNNYAFSGTKIISITLPANMTVIPDYMLQNCTKLESIVIPATVTKIGTSAFSGCTALASVTIETDENGNSNLATFGNNCFQNTALTEFTMPTLAGTSKVTLGNTMFSGCKQLTTITLSKSVASIDGKLSGCYSIKNFVVNEGNENFSFDADTRILYNKEQSAFRYICSGSISGEFVIPDTITELPANIFDSNIALTKITIPRSVVSIGNYAFKNCYSLTEVIFEHSEDAPSQLTSFGTYAFQYCKTLKNVTLPDNLTAIPADCFEYCYELTSIVIPETVTSIGNYAFNQAALKDVVIPCNVVTIGNYAFQGKTNAGTIETLTFAKNPITGECALTTIGNVAFKHQNMTSVVIPKSVKAVGSTLAIGNNAFSYNPNLTSFTFEEGTTIPKFGTDMVRNCPKLATFVVPKSVTILGNSDFNTCEGLKTVIFEDGSLLTTLGTNTFQNCTSLQAIVIPAKVTALGNYDFDGCSSLKSVTFAGTAVKTFGTYLFQNCTSLESIAVPANVTALGNYDFNGCSSLKSITFDGNAVKTLGTYTFQNCTSLESIVIPDSVTVIGTSATAATATSSVYLFKGCTSLKSVTLGANTTLIGGYIFQNCTALESITIPASVTQIGAYDFDGCSSLKSVTFEGTKVNTIGNFAFRNAGLETFKVPASVTAIGTYAFSACESLTSFEVESGVAQLTLGNYVFQNSTALQKVTLSGRVVSIPNYAFAGCKSLSDISLDKVVLIGELAFSSCSSLTSIEFPDSLNTIDDESFLNANLVSVLIPKNVTAIGVNVFAGCHHLEKFEVAPENAKFDVRNGNLFDKEIMCIVSTPNTFSGILHITKDNLPGGYSLNGCHISELIIDEGIKELPEYAFFGAIIDKVTLPESLETISYGMFDSAKIDEIVIPANVTLIDGGAFRNCTLKKITFAEGSKLETLGTYAFAGSDLESITLPAGITKLASTEWLSAYTFKDCEFLTTVRFEGKMEVLNSNAFQNCTALTDIVIPSTVTILGSYLFDGCTSLETIEIPAGCKALYVYSSYANSTSSPMNGYTFRNCTSLKTVILHEGLKDINGYSFQGCTALTSITIPASVEEICTYAFNGCSSLANVIFEKDSALQKVGTYAFAASGLETITLPGAACTAANYIFADCVNLKSVNFTGEITAIPQYAFKNCTSLESFEIPASVTTMGQYAFTGSGLKSIYIPASIEKWNSSPFLDCVNLETVEFEEGCTIVTGSMFSGCTALKSVKLASTITTFTSSAFNNCTSIKEIYMPGSITSLNKIFAGWTSAQTIYFSCSKAESSAWSSIWADECDAKIVWDYEG